MSAVSSEEIFSSQRMRSILYSRSILITRLINETINITCFFLHNFIELGRNVTDDLTASILSRII
jgi:hypothetical protein